MFSLRIKVFLAMLLASALLIICLLGLFQWSFDRGFGAYLQQQEQQRLDLIATELASRFADTKDWKTVNLNHLQRMRPGPQPGGGPPLPPPLSDERPPPGANGFDHLPPRFSLFVLNTEQQLQSGHFDADADNLIRPIELNNTLIGYVGHPVRRGPQAFVDKEFAAHQSQHFLSIAALAALVSLLVAYPLSTALVKRIQKLLSHVQRLSQGEYSATTTASGNDELSLLALHLNALGQTLQQSAQSHRTMVADISHELRTPIAVLQAQLEAVEDGVHPMTDATLRRLQQQVKRLAGLVDDLYELSLADLGALTYRKHTLDLQELVKEQAQAFLPRIQQTGLSLGLRESCSDSLPVLADPQRLQQLFSNLLQNSAQYTNAPGHVILDINRDATHAMITLSDSAPGVEPHLQPKLFDRLFRAESSRNRNSGGAGLGLSLCRTITLAHNGTIDISDSALGGLSICVRIPLASS